MRSIRYDFLKSLKLKYKFFKLLKKIKIAKGRRNITLINITKNTLT